MEEHALDLTLYLYYSLQKFPRPPQDRTMVVACLAEVAQQMGAPISGYVDVRVYFRS